MSVAVITPAFNAAAYLEETLDSVGAQTYRSWTHVVIDDGSVDGTAELVSRRISNEPRLRLISQTNAGQAVARNAGLAAVPDDTQYVVFLDADDRLRSDAFSQLVGLLEQRPDLDAVWGSAAVIDGDGEIVAERDLRRPRRRLGGSWLAARSGTRFVPVASSDDITFDELCVANTITTPGQVMIRRASLPETPFEPGFVPAEDWGLWLQLAKAKPLGVVGATVIDYRQHAGNESGNLARMTAAQRRVRVHCARTITPEREVRRSIRALAAERVGISLVDARRSARQRDMATTVRSSLRSARSMITYATSFVPGVLTVFDRRSV